MGQEFKYFAFISYNSHDTAGARNFNGNWKAIVCLPRCVASMDGSVSL